MTDGYKIKRILVWQNGEEKQIYPAGWKPGSNTLVYYPLTSSTTVNDMSGNNKTLTNNGITFGTYKGVDCAYYSNSSNYLRNTSFYNSAQNLTISLWCYFISNGVTYNGNYNQFLVEWSGIPLYRTSGNEGPINSLIPGNYVMQSDTQWLLATYILDYANSNVKLYVNGTQISSTSAVISGGSMFTIGNNNNAPNYQHCNWIGGISEVIIESTARTADEVSNYYNQTKSNYGL